MASKPNFMTKSEDKKQDRQAAIERRLKITVKNGGNKNGKNGGK